MKNVIEVKKLRKKYKNGFELDLDELKIPSGLIVGLIGANGVGKTTFIKSILNIIKIDEGDIKIFNKNYTDESIKNDIGVVLDESFFPEVLSAKDIDKIMCGIYSSWDSDMFYKYINEFKLQSDKPIKELSKGMKKKLEIITALSHKPKLLILDEPTSGLDPVVRSEILDLFLKFVEDEEHTILLSTHITSDLEQIADKIIFINRGNIILNENKDDIIDDYGILKCDEKLFNKLDKKDILRYRKNKYSYEILVKDKNVIKKKYKNSIVDNITLDELMLLVIKGVEK